MHLADRGLVTSGKIPLKALFTIRRGEPAYNNVRRVVAPATTDIIKIKSAADYDRQVCRYFSTEPASCAIYAERPIECRVLDCRNPETLAALYEQERLTRADLLQEVTGLAELVADHQQRCDTLQLAQLAKTIRLNRDTTAAVEDVLTMLRYDQSLRQVTLERTGLDPQILDFLFGRPLTILLSAYYLRLTGTAAKPTISALYPENP